MRKFFTANQRPTEQTLIVAGHRVVQTLPMGHKIVCSKCHKNDCYKLYCEIGKSEWICEACDT